MRCSQPFETGENFGRRCLDLIAGLTNQRRLTGSHEMVVHREADPHIERECHSFGDSVSGVGQSPLSPVSESPSFTSPPERES